MADETYTKEQLDAAVAKATGDVDGLKAKIEELIGDNKKLKADLRKTQDIKPEDVAAIEGERDKALADLAAANKAAKEATAAAEKANKALETEQAAARTFALDSDVSTLIAKHGVISGAVEMVANHLRSGSTVDVVDGKLVSRRGDKTLAEFADEYFASESGKIVKSASVNGGGDAPGGKGGEGPKTMPRSAFDALGQPERAAFAKEGGKVVDA